jgi:hypothetical protein
MALRCMQGHELLCVLKFNQCATVEVVVVVVPVFEPSPPLDVARAIHSSAATAPTPTALEVPSDIDDALLPAASPAPVTAQVLLLPASNASNKSDLTRFILLSSGVEILVLQRKHNEIYGEVKWVNNGKNSRTPVPLDAKKIH